MKTILVLFTLVFLVLTLYIAVEFTNDLACADLANAELLTNRMKEDNFKSDTGYFIRSHPIVPVVPQQQP